MLRDLPAVTPKLLDLNQGHSAPQPDEDPSTSFFANPTCPMDAHQSESTSDSISLDAAGPTLFHEPCRALSAILKDDAVSAEQEIPLVVQHPHRFANGGLLRRSLRSRALSEVLSSSSLPSDVLWKSDSTEAVSVPLDSCVLPLQLPNNASPISALDARPTPSAPTGCKHPAAEHDSCQSLATAPTPSLAEVCDVKPHVRHVFAQHGEGAKASAAALSSSPPSSLLLGARSIDSPPAESPSSWPVEKKVAQLEEKAAAASGAVGIAGRPMMSRSGMRARAHLVAEPAVSR
jgi:hypothetical protein